MTVRAVFVVVANAVEESLGDPPVFARTAADSTIESVQERIVSLAVLALVDVVLLSRWCGGGSRSGLNRHDSLLICFVGETVRRGSDSAARASRLAR